MERIGVVLSERENERAGGEAAEDTAGEDGSAVAVSPVIRFIVEPPTRPAAAREVFASLAAALMDCLGLERTSEGVVPRAGVSPGVVAQIERVRGFYRPMFERMYDTWVIRTRDLEQLESIASQYKSRGRFITDLTLDPPSATSDLAQPPYLDEDYLILSTVHSAKGCEWTAVHIIHAADGMIPSDMAVSEPAGVDEERRLFYVAMTRAKDHLHIYFPLRYYHQRFGLANPHNYAQLTRFISPAVRALLEEQVGGGVGYEGDAGAERSAREAVRRMLADRFDG
jgi:hypothetical protein